MSSSGYLKREDLIGKFVVSKDAKIVGTVLDLAVSSDGRLAVQVQKKTGDTSEDIFIGPQEIQAVGDVILLKSGSDGAQPPPLPPPPAYSSAATTTTSSSASMGRTCQKCGFVNSANAKFCIKCGNSLM